MIDLSQPPASRRAFLQRGAAITSLILPGYTFAQAPRGGGLRIICTAPGGSIPDIVARRYAEQIARVHPGNVIVDNRPGAAGQIAVNTLRQANADGSTMLLAQGAVATVYPYLYSKLPYDAIADLRPVSMAAETTLALCVGPAVPDTVKTLREFIDWTRTQPRNANVGSPGTGTLPHLLGAMLAREAKVDWQHVPYGGGPPAIADLTGGRILALILPEGLLAPQQAAGKLRVLATSGATRSTFMPAVPTLAESGFPSLVMREWFAFFMPGGTPPVVLDRAARSIQEAALSTALSAMFGEIGMHASTSTPSELGKRIAEEQRYWKVVMANTGIRAD